MHEILGGQPRWAYFTGTNTDWDFVEAPSMMFEEWAWDPSTLQLFAKHVDSKEPIPAELIAKMRGARDFGKGVDTERQLGFAKESLDYHVAADPASIDLDQVERDAVKKHTLFQFVEGTHNWAGFGHLNGYAASYYTYQWSLVIAKDLLSEFKKKGLLDPETARRYRDTILVPGGSRDAADMVKDFLGRPYGFDSYRKWMEQD
jgi:thimet oligopeptidase